MNVSLNRFPMDGFFLRASPEITRSIFLSSGSFRLASLFDGKSGCSIVFRLATLVPVVRFVELPIDVIRRVLGDHRSENETSRDDLDTIGRGHDVRVVHDDVFDNLRNANACNDMNA